MEGNMEPLILSDEDTRLPVIIAGQTYHLSRQRDLTPKQARGLMALYKANDAAIKANDSDTMTDTWVKLLERISDIPVAVLEDTKMSFLNDMILAHFEKAAVDEAKDDASKAEQAGA